LRKRLTKAGDESPGRDSGATPGLADRVAILMTLRNLLARRPGQGALRGRGEQERADVGGPIVERRPGPARGLERQQTPRLALEEPAPQLVRRPGHGPRRPAPASRGLPRLPGRLEAREPLQRPGLAEQVLTEAGARAPPKEKRRFLAQGGYQGAGQGDQRRGTKVQHRPEALQAPGGASAR
jgi:hypothetical protein